MAEVGYELLSVLKGVAEKHVKHTRGGLCIGGCDGDKSSRLRTHCSLPHHLGLVLTKSLGALKSVLL